MKNISVLILWLGLLCSVNSTACSTTTADRDSLPVVTSRPGVFTLTEAGAKAALKAEADLHLTQRELQSANQLIGDQQRTIAGLNTAITSSRNQFQQQSNQSVKWQTDFLVTLQKLRSSRLENWVWRGMAVAGSYLLLKNTFR